MAPHTPVGGFARTVWPSLGDRRFRHEVCACVCCCSADNVVREYTLQKEMCRDDAQTLFIGRFGTLPSFVPAIFFVTPQVLAEHTGALLVLLVT